VNLRSRRIESALIALLLLSVCALSACIKPPGGPVGPVGWTLDNNQRAKLSDYKGKVVLLDFYATWCEPCRAETPHLVSLHKQYAGQGLHVVGLNVGGEDDHSQVPSFAKEFGIQYPLALPDDELVDGLLGNNQSIPQAFVFDRSGKLLKRFIGYSDNSGAELERVVKAAIASSAQ